MNRQPRVARLLCVAVMALLFSQPALVVRAAVPDLISYEGMLTDNIGTPLNGTHSMTFKLYTETPVLGLPSWQETHSSVVVTDGHFAVTLGAVNPITLSMHRPYFLGIAVDGGPELTPRIPLTSAAHTLGLRLPFSTTVNDPVTGLTILNTGTGASIEALGTLKVGSPSVDGVFQLYGAGSTDPMIHITGQTFGGDLRVRDEAGNNIGRLYGDVEGNSGELAVYRGPGQLAFTVDGNWAGTGNALVKIWGTSREVTFRTDLTGDGSVQLPDDAVNATEILDEMGVANDYFSGIMAAPAGFTNLVTHNITAPAPGYILATGNISVAQASDDFAIGLSISKASQSPGVPEIDGYVHPSKGDPLAVQRLFQVGAGTTQFFLVVRVPPGESVYIEDPHLTLLYLPTNYGDVDPFSPQAVAQP